MASAMYEIYVRQEWARANDLTGTIKLSEYLMGTTTDRALVDSGERRRRTGGCQEETRRLVARRHGSDGDHDAAPASGTAGMHGIPRL